MLTFLSLFFSSSISSAVHSNPIFHAAPKKFEEPPAQKKDNPKLSNPPSIVVEDEEPGSVSKHKKGKHLKKGPPSKDEADSDEDVASKPRSPKTKGGKVYVKKPTTILEELEEGMYFMSYNLAYECVLTAWFGLASLNLIKK